MSQELLSSDLFFVTAGHTPKPLEYCFLAKRNVEQATVDWVSISILGIFVSGNRFELSLLFQKLMTLFCPPSSKRFTNQVLRVSEPHKNTALASVLP
jgi:hypothetical protein